MDKVDDKICRGLHDTRRGVDGGHDHIVCGMVSNGGEGRMAFDHMACIGDVNGGRIAAISLRRQKDVNPEESLRRCDIKLPDIGPAQRSREAGEASVSHEEVNSLDALLFLLQSVDGSANSRTTAPVRLINVLPLRFWNISVFGFMNSEPQLRVKLEQDVSDRDE